MSQLVLPPLTAEDEAAIRAVSDRFVESLVSRDFDATARLYTRDAVLMPPHHPVVRGRRAVREWVATFPTVLQCSFTILEIDGRADLAYVRGAFSMRVLADRTAGTVEDAGKYLEIRKRQPNGSWPIVAEIFNSDRA